MPSFLHSGSFKIVTSFVQKYLGRIKRKPFFWLLSLVGIIVFSHRLSLWTSVPVYTHIFAVDHPFSVDTTNNHYVVADIRLLLNDAFPLQKRNENPYIFRDRFCTIYVNGVKNENCSKPDYPTSNKVNHYMNRQLFGIGLDTISGKMNLSTYIHFFSSDVDEILNNMQINEMDFELHEDDNKEKHPYYCWTIFNDPSVRGLPYFQDLLHHIQTVEFFRDIQAHAEIIISDEDDKPMDQRFVLEQNSGLSNWQKLKVLFTRNHDISKARYMVFYRISGIDSTSLQLIFNESVEFSDFSGGGKQPVVKRDRVVYRFEGDQTSDHILASIFHVHFLESQNAQDLRVLLLTTMLAFLMACFLKISIDLILRCFSKKSCKEKIGNE